MSQVKIPGVGVFERTEYVAPWGDVEYVVYSMVSLPKGKQADRRYACFIAPVTAAAGWGTAAISMLGNGTLHVLSITAARFELDGFLPSQAATAGRNMEQESARRAPL